MRYIEKLLDETSSFISICNAKTRNQLTEEEYHSMLKSHGFSFYWELQWYKYKGSIKG